MDRAHRMASRKCRTIHRLNETARILDRAMEANGIMPSEKEPFLNWVITSMWNNFKQDRMNRRLVIENDIKDLRLRFPNGTVKTQYSVFFSLPLDKISDITLDGIEDLCLSLIIDENGLCSLAGRPTQVGDFTLKLRYNTIAGEPRSELSIPIAFNPNPRDLWKNIPTDRNILFYKPDCECEYVKVESKADGMPCKDIVAASQRGRSHAQEGKPRDDHFRLFHSDDSDWYVIAVADGAGSAKFSRRGSEIACNVVVEECKKRLTNNPAFEDAIRDYNAQPEDMEKRIRMTNYVHDIVLLTALKAHEAINTVAAANSESARLKDFATTLMFAICKKFEFGWFIASFWVGDGAICILDTDRKIIKLLGTPDEGEFSGQTRFLTMPEIFRDPDLMKKRLRATIVPDFTALFLLTDGVSDPMFETDKNLNDYAKWEEFYRRLTNGFPEDAIGGVDLSDDNEQSKEQLLKWLDFWSQGNHDDRTIAILY